MLGVFQIHTYPLVISHRCGCQKQFLQDLPTWGIRQAMENPKRNKSQRFSNMLSNIKDRKYWETHKEKRPLPYFPHATSGGFPFPDRKVAACAGSLPLKWSHGDPRPAEASAALWHSQRPQHPRIIPSNLTYSYGKSLCLMKKSTINGDFPLLC